MRQNHDTHRDRLIVFGATRSQGKPDAPHPLLGAAGGNFQRVLSERTVRTDRAFVAKGNSTKPV
jgi:hypothetical protein